MAPASAATGNVHETVQIAIVDVVKWIKAHLPLLQPHRVEGFEPHELQARDCLPGWLAG